MKTKSCSLPEFQKKLEALDNSALLDVLVSLRVEHPRGRRAVTMNMAKSVVAEKVALERMA